MINEEETAVTVQEVPMQEWAMLAFHAARAPQRVRVTVKIEETSAVDDRAVAGMRTGVWVLAAAAVVGAAWWLL